jgi:hypothetical protein
VADDSSSLPPRGPLLWGRRLARGTYYAVATLIAGAATVQITQQVFFPEIPDGQPPFSTCSEGIEALYAAIERGRIAADPRAVTGPFDADPEKALQRYRDAVRPVWAHRPAVDALCEGQHGRLLDALERLRYSEEHGVRHQAVERSALRRRVREQVAEILPIGAMPPPSVTP